MSSLVVAVRIKKISESDHVEEKDRPVVFAKDGYFIDLINNRSACNGKPGVEEVHRFSFDFCFNEQESQSYIYSTLSPLVVGPFVNGNNSCIIAYGQTGSGKTYTMLGNESDPGLIPRICETILTHSYSIRECCMASFYEVYNDKVRDLLKPQVSDPSNISSKCRVREHPVFGPYVSGLSWHSITSLNDITMFLKMGCNSRSSSLTNMHNSSSRSHAIFTIVRKNTNSTNGTDVFGTKMYLVDLAGSEKPKHQSTKDQVKEGAHINKSLATLGNVILTLSAQKSYSTYIPYRNSTLTWLLKDAIGGTARTVMIGSTQFGTTARCNIINDLQMEIQRLNTIIQQNMEQFCDNGHFWNNSKCPNTVCRSVMTSPVDGNCFNTKGIRDKENSIKENCSIHNVSKEEENKSISQIGKNTSHLKKKLSDQKFVVMENQSKPEPSKNWLANEDDSSLTHSWISMDFHDKARFTKSHPVTIKSRKSATGGNLSETLYPKSLKDANRPSFSFLKKLDKDKSPTLSSPNETDNYADLMDFDDDNPSAWMAKHSSAEDIAEEEIEENHSPPGYIKDDNFGDRFTKSFNYTSQPKAVSTAQKKLSASTNNFLQRQKVGQTLERPSFNYLKKQPVVLETFVDSDTQNNNTVIEEDYFSNFVEYGILPLSKSESGLKSESESVSDNKLNFKDPAVLPTAKVRGNDKNQINDKFGRKIDTVKRESESEYESEKENGERVNFDGLNTSSATAYNSSFSSQTFTNNNKDGFVGSVDNHFSPTSFFMQNLKVNFEGENSFGEEANDTSSINNDRSRNTRKVVRARAELRRLKQASDSSTASESSARKQKGRHDDNHEDIPEGDVYVYDVNVPSDMASLNGDSLDVDSDKDVDQLNRKRSSIFHSSFKQTMSDEDVESVAEEIDQEETDHVNIVHDSNESDIPQDTVNVSGNTKVTETSDSFWKSESINYSDEGDIKTTFLTKTKSFLQECEDPTYSTESLDSAETVISSSSPTKQLLDKISRPLLLDLDDQDQLSISGTNVMTSPSREALVIRIKLIEKDKTDLAEIPVICDFLSPADFSDDYNSDEVKNASTSQKGIYSHLPTRFKLKRNIDGLHETDVFSNDTPSTKPDWLPSFGLNKPIQENTKNDSYKVVCSDFFDTRLEPTKLQKQTGDIETKWIPNKIEISPISGEQSPAQSASFSSDFEPESPVQKQQEKRSHILSTTSSISNDHTETDIKIAVTSLQLIQTGLIPWVLFEKFPLLGDSTMMIHNQNQFRQSAESNNDVSTTKTNRSSSWAWNANDKPQKHIETRSMSHHQPLKLEEIDELQDDYVDNLNSRSLKVVKAQSIKESVKHSKSLGHDTLEFHKFDAKSASSGSKLNNKTTPVGSTGSIKLTKQTANDDSFEAAEFYDTSNNKVNTRPETSENMINFKNGKLLEERDFNKNSSTSGVKDGFRNSAVKSDLPETLPSAMFSQSLDKTSLKESVANRSLKEFRFSSAGIPRNSFFGTSSSSVEDQKNEVSRDSYSATHDEPIPMNTLIKMKTNLEDNYLTGVKSRSDLLQDNLRSPSSNKTDLSSLFKRTKIDGGIFCGIGIEDKTHNEESQSLENEVTDSTGNSPSGVSGCVIDSQNTTDEGINSGIKKEKNLKPPNFTNEVSGSVIDNNQEVHFSVIDSSKNISYAGTTNDNRKEEKSKLQSLPQNYINEVPGSIINCNGEVPGTVINSGGNISDEETIQESGKQEKSKKQNLQNEVAGSIINGNRDGSATSGRQINSDEEFVQNNEQKDLKRKHLTNEVPGSIFSHNEDVAGSVIESSENVSSYETDTNNENGDLEKDFRDKIPLDTLSRSLDNYNKTKIENVSANTKLKELHYSDIVSRDSFLKPDSPFANHENASRNNAVIRNNSTAAIPLEKMESQLNDKLDMYVQQNKKTMENELTASQSGKSVKTSYTMIEQIKDVTHNSPENFQNGINSNKMEGRVSPRSAFLQNFGIVIPSNVHPVINTVNTVAHTTSDVASNREFRHPDRENFFQSTTNYIDSKQDQSENNNPDDKKLEVVHSSNGLSMKSQSSNDLEDVKENDQHFSNDRMPKFNPSEKTKYLKTKIQEESDSHYMDNLNKFLPSPILNYDPKKRHNPFAFSGTMGSMENSKPKVESFQEFLYDTKEGGEKTEVLDNSNAAVSNIDEHYEDLDFEKRRDDNDNFDFKPSQEKNKGKYSSEETESNIYDEIQEIEVNIDSDDDDVEEENYPEISYQKHDDDLDYEQSEDGYLVPSHRHIDLDNDNTQDGDDIFYHFDKKSENIIDPSRKLSPSKSLAFDSTSVQHNEHKRLSESYPKVDKKFPFPSYSNLSSKSVSRDSLKLDFKDLIEQNNGSFQNDDEDSETKRRKSVSWSDLREGLPLEHGPEWGSPHLSPLKSIIKRPSVGEQNIQPNPSGNKAYLLPFYGNLQDNTMVTKSDQNLNNSDRNHIRHAFSQTEPLPQTKSVSTLTIQEVYDNYNKIDTATPTPSVSMENLKRYQTQSVLNDLQMLVIERDKLLENMNNELTLWKAPPGSIGSPYRSDAARNLMNEHWWKLWRIKNDLDKRIDEMFLKYRTQRALDSASSGKDLDWLSIPHSALLTLKNKSLERTPSSTFSSRVEEECSKIHLTPFEYDKKLVNLRKTLVSTSKDLHHRSVPDLNTDFENLEKRINENFDMELSRPFNKMRYSKNWMEEIDNEFKFGAQSKTNYENSSLSLLQEARKVRQLSNSVLKETKQSLNQPKYFPIRLEHVIAQTSSIFNRSLEDKEIDEEIQKLRNQYKIKQILGHK